MQIYVDRYEKSKVLISHIYVSFNHQSHEKQLLGIQIIHYGQHQQKPSLLAQLPCGMNLEHSYLFKLRTQFAKSWGFIFIFPTGKRKNLDMSVVGYERPSIKIRKYRSPWFQTKVTKFEYTGRLYLQRKGIRALWNCSGESARFVSNLNSGICLSILGLLVAYATLVATTHFLVV